MNEANSKVLKILGNFVNSTYQNCASERTKLHKTEWEHGNNLPSILGEIEVKAGTIIGISQCFNKEEPKQIERLIKELNSCSIYDLEIVLDWIIKDSNQYPKYLTHIQAIENLRIGTLFFFKKTRKPYTKHM